MNSEKEFEYSVQLLADNFNETGKLKPVSYLKMMQYVTECHLKKFNLNIDKMAYNNLAWVLATIIVDIKNPPTGCDIIKGITWHSDTSWPYFRREFKFFNENGQEAFNAVSFSVLINLQKRCVLRRSNEIDIGQGNKEFTINDAKPVLRDIEEYDFIEKRKVYNSYIDILGHVNNTYYCDFAFDTLTEDEKLKDIKRININFKSELRQGDVFSIYKGRDGNVTYFRGIREEDEKKSFSIAFTFA
ncbi:MAG: thioesterase [Eubacteriales bacterium]